MEQAKKLMEHTLANVERAQKLVQEQDLNELSCGALDIHLKTTETRWTLFNDRYNSLLEFDLGDYDANAQYIKGEEAYIEARIKLTEKLQEKQPVQPVAQPVPQVVQVQLPDNQEIRNNWGTFDGTLTKWPGFYDLFKAQVHDNEKITPAYKFGLLKKSLTNEAAEMFGQWQITDQNYTEAFDRLKQCYDQKYQICREYLKHFFSLPFLSHPSSDLLRQLSNGTHEMFRQLRAQGLPVEHWDMVIVHCLHDRFDGETARQWELERDSETPTTKQILDFIDKQANALKPVHSVQSSTRVFDRLALDTGRGGAVSRHGAWRGSHHSSTTSSNALVTSHFCRICKTNHQLYNCPEFLNMSINGRKEFVDQSHICSNCLKQGHTPKDCFTGPCPTCKDGTKHNSLLCPKYRRDKQTKAINQAILNFYNKRTGDNSNDE